jgi:hypothetical protein
MLILPQVRELQRADLTDQVGNGSNTLQTGSWRNITGTFSDISSDNTEIYCTNFNASVTIRASSNSSYVVNPTASNSITRYLGKSYFDTYNLNYTGSQSTYSVVSSVCYVSALHSFSIGDSVYVDFSSGGASALSNYYSITQNRRLMSSTYSISTTNLGTINSSSAHNLSAGDEFQITFDTGGGSIYNGTYRVRAVTSSTSFTFLFPYLQQVLSYSGSSTLFLLNQEFAFNLSTTNTSGNCSYRIYVDTPITLRKGFDGLHGQGGGGAGGQGSGGGGGGGGGGSMNQVPFGPIPMVAQSGYDGQGGQGGNAGSVGNLNGSGGSGGTGATLVNFFFRRGGYGGNGGDGLGGSGGSLGRGGWEGQAWGINGEAGDATFGGFPPDFSYGGAGGTGYTSNGSGGAGGGGGQAGFFGARAGAGGGGAGQGGAGNNGGGGNTSSSGSSGTNPSKSLFLLIDNRAITNAITVQSNTADVPTNPTLGNSAGQTAAVGGQGGQGGQGSRGNISRILIFNRFQTYNNASFTLPSQTNGSSGTTGSSGSSGGGGGQGSGGRGGQGGWVAFVGDQNIYPYGQSGLGGSGGSLGGGGFKGSGGIGGEALKFVPRSNKIYF